MAKVNGAFRSKRGFTAVDNSIIKDKNVSLKAKGLYLVIQSCVTNPNITTTKDYLRSICSEGSKAFDSAFDELKEQGYLHIHFHTQRGSKGFFIEYELLDVADPGAYNFYYDADGNLTKTNLTRSSRSDKSGNNKDDASEKGSPAEAMGKKEGKEHNPQNGIYVNGSYVNGAYVDGSYVNGNNAKGGNNINTDKQSNKLRKTDNTVYDSNILSGKTDNKNSFINNPSTYTSNKDSSLSLNGTNIGERENVMPSQMQTKIVKADKRDMYEAEIKRNIDYETFAGINKWFMKMYDNDKINEDELNEHFMNLEICDRLIQFMADVCADNKPVLIRGKTIKAEVIKKRLLDIDQDQFRDAYKILAPRWSGIDNKKNYSISVLFEI